MTANYYPLADEPRISPPGPSRYELAVDAASASFHDRLKSCGYDTDALQKLAAELLAVADPKVIRAAIMTAVEYDRGPGDLGADMLVAWCRP